MVHAWCWSPIMTRPSMSGTCGRSASDSPRWGSIGMRRPIPTMTRPPRPCLPCRHSRSTSARCRDRTLQRIHRDVDRAVHHATRVGSACAAGFDRSSNDRASTCRFELRGHRLREGQEVLADLAQPFLVAVACGQQGGGVERARTASGSRPDRSGRAGGASTRSIIVESVDPNETPRARPAGH